MLVLLLTRRHARGMSRRLCWIGGLVAAALREGVSGGRAAAGKLQCVSAATSSALIALSRAPACDQGSQQRVVATNWGEPHLRWPHKRGEWAAGLWECALRLPGAVEKCGTSIASASRQDLPTAKHAALSLRCEAESPS